MREIIVINKSFHQQPWPLLKVNARHSHSGWGDWSPTGNVITHLVIREDTEPAGLKAPRPPGSLLPSGWSFPWHCTMPSLGSETFYTPSNQIHPCPHLSPPLSLTRLAAFLRWPPSLFLWLKPRLSRQKGCLSKGSVTLSRRQKCSYFPKSVCLCRDQYVLT